MTNKVQPTYEELSAKLELVIAKLQEGSTSIDESLALYEQAVAITDQMAKYLKNAKNRLVKINQKIEAD